MSLTLWIVFGVAGFVAVSLLIGVALGYAFDKLGRTPKPPFRPTLVPDPEPESIDLRPDDPGPDVDTNDPSDLCDVHGCELVWTDSGGPESGPGEPYLTCPKCDDEHAPHCPKCGASESDGYEARAVPTRAYGGGFDTFYRCPKCGFTDVAT